MSGRSFERDGLYGRSTDPGDTVVAKVGRTWRDLDRLAERLAIGPPGVWLSREGFHLPESLVYVFYVFI